MAARRPPSQSDRAEALGARVRTLRRKKRMTQKEVAKEIPMSAGNLSRIEAGVYGPPSDEVIERLATVLGGNRIELMRAAGRNVGGPTFEDQVLGELATIRDELNAGLLELKDILSTR